MVFRARHEGAAAGGEGGASGARWRWACVVAGAKLHIVNVGGWSEWSAWAGHKIGWDI